MSAEVADVLDDAADYIEKHGWVQGSLGGDGGPACAVHALCGETTAPSIEVFVDAFRAFADRIGVDDNGCAIGQWNDEPGRTQQEVLDAFRLAAKQQRMDGTP